MNILHDYPFARPVLQATQRFIKSIWLFPAILTLILIVLTSLQLSGSSMGYYHSLFYGPAKDQNLIYGKPQSIRSDEWLVNSQMTIAQKNNDYARINKNIGNGEDVSLMVDAPYKDWSVIFKPHNLAFFVMPFEHAFAFKWWFIAYLLVLSCYFFVLTLLPGKKMLAVFLAVGLLCNPFIQWWYLYGTLGAIAFSLFGGTIAIKLLREKRLLPSLLWGLLLIYVVASFAIILYPPFQIAVGLAMLAFVAGYAIEKLRDDSRRIAWQKIGVIVGAVAVAGAITAVYLLTRMDVVRTVQNTAYPGNRIQQSGEFDVVHLFSGHLGGQLQSPAKFNHYLVSGQPSNPSEASNFLLFLPFLLLPSLYLIYKSYKGGHGIDWPLALVNAAFVIMMVWLFVPNLAILGKITFLERVPHGRLLIGLGVLNLLQLVLFIRHSLGSRSFVISQKLALLYAAGVFVAELGLNFYVWHHSAGFIGLRIALVLALPVAIIVYLLLRRHFKLATGGLALFLVLMVIHVNPVYRGTSMLEKTPISIAIQDIAAQDKATWAVEYFTLENFAFMNGARSISGVYTYPQLKVWQDADPQDEESVYNRYAHTSFAFDRDPAVNNPTKLKLLGQDNMNILTEPCSKFLVSHNVRYLLASARLSAEDSCASLVKQIDYPAITFFIYRLEPTAR